MPSSEEVLTSVLDCLFVGRTIFRLKVRQVFNGKDISVATLHIFKVFVANPNKQDGIKEILKQNDRKLIAFLEMFQPEKDSVEFVQEKELLVSTLKGLRLSER